MDVTAILERLQDKQTVLLLVAAVFACAVLHALWRIRDYVHWIQDTLSQCQHELEYANKERRERERFQRELEHMERVSEILSKKPEAPPPPMPST